MLKQCLPRTLIWGPAWRSGGFLRFHKKGVSTTVENPATDCGPPAGRNPYYSMIQAQEHWAIFISHTDLCSRLRLHCSYIDSQSE
jgi:hypothetical protein